MYEWKKVYLENHPAWEEWHLRVEDLMGKVWCSSSGLWRAVLVVDGMREVLPVYENTEAEAKDAAEAAILRHQLPPCE